MRPPEGLESVDPESRPKASGWVSGRDKTRSRAGSYAQSPIPAQDGLLAMDSH